MDNKLAQRLRYDVSWLRDDENVELLVEKLPSNRSISLCGFKLGRYILIANISKKILRYSELDRGQFYVLATDNRMLYQKKSEDETIILHNQSYRFSPGQTGKVKKDVEVRSVVVEDMIYKIKN